MKSQKSGDKILMIAQQILKQSVSRQGINKLNEIKKSLQIRSSKTRTKSQEKSKQKIRRMSSSSIRKVPLSPRADTQIRKRSISKPEETYAKSYSKIDSRDQEYPRTRKRSVRFSFQQQPSQIRIYHPKSPLKQQNHSQKTILKQSSLKKPASPRQNVTSQLSTAKYKPYPNHTKPTLQNFSAEHIVAKKLFGNDPKQKPIIENEISFNLNLNKLLQTVEKIIETQKAQKQNVYGNRKESLLSRENIRLIRKISKKLIGTVMQDDVNLEKDFHKNNKRSQDEMNQSTPSRTKVKQPSKQGHMRIDYISQQSDQGAKNDQNQFKVIQLQAFKNDSKISSLSNNQQEQFSVTTEKYDSIDDSLKHRKPNPTNEVQLKQMNQKLEGLRKDKKWLVETVESLLNENQQLKKLLVGNR